MQKDNGKHRVAVVIPIYKKELTLAEFGSINQALLIFKQYNIVFIFPKSLDISYYKNLCLNYKNIQFKEFGNKYFADISGYNRLMLSKTFYSTFVLYEFILVYQSDAWVFRDELMSWCSLGYDYIGAPWFSSDNPTDSLPHFIGIGNGGFSLRNVKSHLKVLKSFSYIISPKYLLYIFLKNPKMENFARFLLGVSITNNTFHLLGKNKMYEDKFWNTIVRTHRWFIMPDMITASQFSTETNSEKLYLINKKLPFGCHAWQTYEPLFWASHINYDYALG